MNNENLMRHSALTMHRIRLWRIMAVSSCTGAQGNNYCIFFVQESLIS